MSGSKKTKEMTVSARLSEKEQATLEQVLDLMEEATGERNVSAALRYIVAHFKVESSPLGKGFALAA